SAITNYQVWRSLSPGTESFFANAGPKLWFNDTGLTNGQTYYYKVSAENSQGRGPDSSEVLATPIQTLYIPTAPQNLAANPGSSQIVLTWSAPPSNGGSSITGYKVYRGTSSGGETLLISIGNVLSYTNTGLTNGQTYYYKVSAVNAVGEGPQSTEASATPATVPSAPQSLSAAPGNAQITVTWTAPSSNGGSTINGYKIYRGTSAQGETLLTTLGNVLTYLDSGLTNGQTYYYKVSALNSVGEGAQSAEASAVPVTVPSPPTLISSTPANAQVVLAWTAPSNNGGSSITNYKVYRGTSSGGETLLTTIGNLLSLTDTGLTNGQTYYYKVSAVNSVGEGGQSNELNARPTGPPAAPQSVQTKPGDAFVNLTWLAPASDGGSAIIDYQVMRGLTSGMETFLADAGLKLWFNDTGLNNGQTYYYRVRAVNALGAGPNSSEVSATPSQTATVPSAPQSLTAIASNAQVALSWYAPSDNGGASITNYAVYRGTTPGGETLLTMLGDLLTHTDAGLPNGQTFYYKVSALNSVGEGPRSNEASATPATVPSAPQGLSATAGDAQVTLAWTPPSDDGGSPITNYVIYRGTTSGAEVMLASVGDVLTYLDSGLSNGQSHYYKVSAINAYGEGSLSEEAFATPGTVPSAPLGLIATPGDSFINLTWMPPASDGGSPILNYTIYRGASPGGESFLLTIEASPSYVDSGLSNSVTYYYKVSATNARGEGALSNEASATPAIVPSEPQHLMALAGDAEVNLTWDAPLSDGGSPVIGYNLYRGASSDNVSLLVVLADVLSYLDGGLTNGQTYFYKVSACNAFGEGAASAEASAVPATVPSAPRNLTASRGNGQIHLEWSSPESDGGSPVTNYTIYRSIQPGTATILAVMGDALNYTDTGLTNGLTYYYVVRAINAIGEGEPSGEASATPASVPSAPLNLTATPGASQITLNWTEPVSDGGSQITNYTIYRGISSGGEVLLVVIGDALSYVDSLLTNGQIYYYVISASSAIGEGPLSEEAHGKPPTTPSAPENLTAFSGDRQIALSWTSPGNDGGSPISGYRIYRGGSPGQLSLLTSVGDVLAYTDGGLENGRAYYYMVGAVNSVGEGAPSFEAWATPSTVPSAPLGLQTLAGDRAIELNWTSPSYVGPGELYYHLLRDEVVIWSGPSTSYRDTQVTKGRLYSYQVAAQNSVGRGTNGSTMRCSAFGPPDPPWGLTTAPGNGEVSLSWEEVNYSGPGLLTYSIYRDGWRIWSGNATDYLDVSVHNGMTYSYQVAASNAIGWSANSSMMSTAPQGPPTTPLGLQARPGPGSVQLNWSAPAYCGPGNLIYILFRDGMLIWSGEETEFEDSGLPENVAHSYTIVAYNSIGRGANSTSVQVVPLSTHSEPPPYWGLVTFLGFVGIAAIPMSMLAYRMYHIRYIRSVSMLPDMRCPSCGTIIPATAAKCPV
ncbi:MAG: fibronectin type III domain-containing protein, partial [Methanomassiliicoccales archaeon]|nr:fibronectin type III domain-containing protein [Methanomassiliicoccales archaeon]